MSQASKKGGMNDIYASLPRSLKDQLIVRTKVEADGEVEVEWEVPALPFHRLLMFSIRIYRSLTTGSIQASRLFVSQRDLMSRK